MLSDADPAETVPASRLGIGLQAQLVCRELRFKGQRIAMSNI